MKQLLISNSFLGMKRVVFLMVLSVVLLTGCTPQNLFLVDSEAIWSWNRSTGKMELVWRFKTMRPAQDSVPDYKPMVINPDSLKVLN